MPCWDCDGTQCERELCAEPVGLTLFREAAAHQLRRTGPPHARQRIEPGDRHLLGFGRDIRRGQSVAIGVWIDGAMPQRAETVQGYIQGLHAQWLSDAVMQATGIRPASGLVNIEFRYRYNPDVKSKVAIAPAVIPILLLLIPAILTALSVVREKELGSIVNFDATPVTAIEFLIGKQLPTWRWPWSTTSCW